MSDRAPAFAARPSDLVIIEGREKGSASREGERIEVRRYSDATLADRMHARAQLSDRQHEAAIRMAGMWVAAGLSPRCTGGYGGGRGGSDSEIDAASPLDLYRRIMRQVPQRYVPALEAMLCDQHPGWAGMDALQGGLDWLADVWGITGEE